MSAEKYDDVLLPFLALMRKELHANSGKGDRPGWLRMDANTALLEVYWHVAKLSAAVKNNDGTAIMEHSADVANMAMMVLDVCGGLAWVEEADPTTVRAFEIADEAMFEWLTSYGVWDGSPDESNRCGLAGPNFDEANTLGGACGEIREAFEWLQPRGYVELGKDDDGEFINVLRRPGDAIA